MICKKRNFSMTLFNKSVNKHSLRLLMTFFKKCHYVLMTLFATDTFQKVSLYTNDTFCY